MNIQPNISQTNFYGIRNTLPKVARATVVSSVQTNSINKATGEIAKSTLGKGVMFSGIGAFFLSIINLFKSSAKTKENDAQASQSNNKTEQTNKIPIEKKVELEYTPENVKMLKQRFIQALNYEKKINFANIEILQKVPEEKRARIISYLQSHYDDAKHFLAFATGEAPATLQCVDTKYYNVYREMYGDKFNIISLDWDGGGEIIVNRNSVKKIISDNLEFFKIRLNLPANAKIEDVERTLFYCSLNTPLNSKKNYADIMELILGNDIYDACHKQIVKDISKRNMFFFAGQADSLEEYKTLLKKSVLSKTSSYKDMPQSFKDKLIKSIDSIPEIAFKERILEPVEFTREAKSELDKFRRMERIVEKLENAQKNGTTIRCF